MAIYSTKRSNYKVEQMMKYRAELILLDLNMDPSRANHDFNSFNTFS